MKGIKIQKEIEIKNLYTIFSQKFNSSYFFEGESHDFWEMICVLDGNLGITGGKYVYSIKRGECFFHRPLEFHRLWAEDGTEPETAIFTFSCSNMINVKHGVYKLGNGEIKKIQRLIKKSDEIFYKDDIMITGLKENQQYELQIFVNELENFIINILSKGYSEKAEIRSTAAEKYTSVIKIMEENIEKRLSAEQLALMCNMSLANLKKVFKKYSGRGVMEYFGDMKIKAAKAMLKEGKSVKETALLLGFYDQNYFNVFFKRYTGISPGKYR